MRAARCALADGLLLMLLVAFCTAHGAGRDCEVFNGSESLDEFKQHWRIHCIGTRESPGELWSVEGTLICTALQSILFPWPTPPRMQGVQGRGTLLVVDFRAACIWCPIIYSATAGGPPPASAICKCCLGLWPCTEGAIDPFPEIRRSLYAPVISVERSYSVARDSSLLIEITAYDRDGDLRVVYWSLPRHGRLVESPPGLLRANLRSRGTLVLHS